MHKRLVGSQFFAIFAVAMLVLSVIASTSPSRAAAATRTLLDMGTTSFRESAPGTGELSTIERPRKKRTGQTPNAPGPSGGQGFPSAPLPNPVVPSTRVTTANPDLVQTFAGLNHRDQRTANGGNQFSLEPPDQGLCVGNGFVLETVNDVLRVYSASNGSALTGVIDQNTFYKYPAAFNRTTGAFGPFITDPVCHFDAPTKRWFHVILTLDVVPTDGSFTGRNHIDIAVSKTSDPRGEWRLYSIDATNDGKNGTPSHPNCPCIGDFPHIGVDAYGVFITTNEYSFFADGFNGAQLYAISKKRLAAGRTSLSFVHLDNLKIVGSPAFTLWPAISPANDFDTRNDGTQYFLSSLAGDGSETGNPTRTDRRIGLWAATNTRQLDRDDPDIRLERTIINTGTYTFPPPADQKAGNFPLGQCINDRTLATPFGPGCWQILFNPPAPAATEVLGKLDSSDSRFLTATYAGGLLWGALNTGVNVGGKIKAGIAYYVIRPDAEHLKKSTLVRQGYLGVANNNLLYPAIAVTPSGKAVIAMTLVGADHHPSAAYTRIDASGDDRQDQGDSSSRRDESRGDSIHIASPGRGPQDGFSEYKAFGDPPRPRWGDYGKAVVDGNSIWIASESIEQSCTLAQYTAGVSATSFGSFGSCNGTRTSLANWGTRISQIRP